ncbi:Uncharacterized protein LW93_11784 [Fusarium fujikuroi]|nr:Uncharacterized protein LW93_11784 [Fusarium fujikuroi]
MITVLTATLNSPDKGQLNSESKRTGEPPRLGGEWNHCEFVSCLFVLDLAAISRNPAIHREGHQEVLKFTSFVCESEDDDLKQATSKCATGFIFRLKTWECENGSILGQSTPYTGYESSTWGKVDVPGRDKKGQKPPRQALVKTAVETSQAGNLLGLAYLSSFNALGIDYTYHTFKHWPVFSVNIDD